MTGATMGRAKGQGERRGGGEVGVLLGTSSPITSRSAQRRALEVRNVSSQSKAKLSLWACAAARPVTRNSRPQLTSQSREMNKVVGRERGRGWVMGGVSEREAEEEESEGEATRYGRGRGREEG